MARNIPSQALGGSVHVAPARSRGWRLAAVLLAAAALGCAEAPLAGPEPDGPPPFQGLSRLVLLRRVEGARARPRDPLDAVADGLAAGGREARAVDLGSRAQPRALRALFDRVASRVEAAGSGSAWGPARRGAPAVERLGAVAGEALAAEGVDGAVVYVRLGRLPVLPPAPLGGPFGRDPLLDAAAPPAAALALVDRAGNLVWFGWGGAEPAPGAPATAAEAVDALLRVIDGTPLSEVLDG